MLLTLRTRSAPDPGHGKNVASRRTRIFVEKEVVQHAGFLRIGDFVKD